MARKSITIKVVAMNAKEVYKRDRLMGRVACLTLQAKEEDRRLKAGAYESFERAVAEQDYLELLAELHEARLELAALKV